MLLAATTSLVVVMGLLATGAFAASSSGDSDNLVVNGSFEQGLSHWTGGGPAKLAITHNAHRGKNAAVLTSTSTATVVINDYPNTVASTTAGMTYVASAWVRTAHPNVTTQLRLRGTAGGRLLQSPGSYKWLRDTSWHQLQTTFVAAQQGESIDLNVLVWGMRPDQNLIVDQVRLTASGAASSPSPSTSGSPSASGSPSVSPSASGSASPSAPPSVSPSPSPSPSPSGSSSGCVVGAKLVPSCGALWGLYTPYASGSWTTAYLNAEALTGRRFAVVKRYHDWSGAGSNGAFPDASEQQLSAGGRLLFLAWESRVFGQSGTVSWSRIAAGDYDSAIVRPEAERIKAFGRPVFLDFDHEMDTSVWAGAGLPADYVAAYRHIHDVFAQVGASNVVWVWTSTGYLGAASKIAASYPGDAYVDWIGYDPYNFNSCNGTAWKTADQTIDPFYQWLMANGHQNKPFMLAEYGSTLSGQSSSEVGSWYSSMVSALQSHPNIKAALEFNSASQGPKGLCDSRVTTNPQVLSGFSSAGRQNYVEVKP